MVFGFWGSSIELSLHISRNPFLKQYKFQGRVRTAETFFSKTCTIRCVDECDFDFLERDAVPSFPTMPTRKPDRSFGRNFRSAKSSFNPRRAKTIDSSSIRASEATSQDEKIEATRLAHTLDESMGFARFDSGKKRVGWLCNMHSTSVEDEKVPGGRAGVDFYFLEEDGGSFKATVEYDPYFLIAVKRGREAEVEEWCRRNFEGVIKGIKRIEKEDLQMPNHLLGYRRPFLQLTFANVGDLLGARKVIMPTAEKNKKNMNAMDTYAEVARSVRSHTVFQTTLTYFQR